MQEPMYIKIHNRIERDIEDRKYKVGERIPAERQLALKSNVSRMTLRQIIKTLEDEGILGRRLGSRTYVSSQKVQEEMSGIMSFTDITRVNGQALSSKLLSYRVTKPFLSEKEKLKIKGTDNVLKMECVRFADNVPICHEVAIIPYKLVSRFSKDETSSNLYQTLEKNGDYEIGSVIENIGASVVNENEACLLSAKKGEPLVTRRQVTELNDHYPFEYVCASYIAERFEFTFEK